MERSIDTVGADFGVQQVSIWVRLRLGHCIGRGWLSENKAFYGRLGRELDLGRSETDNNEANKFVKDALEASVFSWMDFWELDRKSVV